MSEEQQRPEADDGKKIELTEHEQRSSEPDAPITTQMIGYPIDRQLVMERVAEFLDRLESAGPLDHGRHHFLSLCFGVSTGCWVVTGFNQERFGYAP